MVKRSNRGIVPKSAFLLIMFPCGLWHVGSSTQESIDTSGLDHHWAQWHQPLEQQQDPAVCIPSHFCGKHLRVSAELHVLQLIVIPSHFSGKHLRVLQLIVIHVHQRWECVAASHAVRLSDIVYNLQTNARLLHTKDALVCGCTGSEYSCEVGLLVALWHQRSPFWKNKNV